MVENTKKGAPSDATGKADAANAGGLPNPWPWCAHDGTCSCAKFHSNPEGCETRAERGIQPATSAADAKDADFDCWATITSRIKADIMKAQPGPMGTFYVQIIDSLDEYARAAIAAQQAAPVAKKGGAA